MSDDTTVLSEEGRQCVAGEVGKLARSGNIPLGYFKDPVKTAETFRTFDGKRWVIPGDFAQIEDDGQITLLGRGSVCINSGGEKIFAEEVEAAVKAHPDVYDCVVTGRPSERWGNEVVAVVRLKAGATTTEASLLDVAQNYIARFKLPKQFVFVETIVRSPAGKADYRWAKQIAIDAAS
jgi:acyl-CoA synthetase (AMP-forming)/AMP-acid ligase II